MASVCTRAAQIAALNALTGTGGIFHGLKCRLFKNNIQVTEGVFISVTPGDGGLEECTFDGYAESPVVVFSTAFNNPDGNAECVAQSLVFPAADATVTQTCHGYYLVTPGVGSAPDVLVKAETFATPQNITDMGDAVVVAPTVELTLAGTAEVPF